MSEPRQMDPKLVVSARFSAPRVGDGAFWANHHVPTAPAVVQWTTLRMTCAGCAKR